MKLLTYTILLILISSSSMAMTSEEIELQRQTELAKAINECIKGSHKTNWSYDEKGTILLCTDKMTKLFSNKI